MLSYSCTPLQTMKGGTWCWSFKMIIPQAVILSLTAFLFQSASLGVHVTVVLSTQMAWITESVIPKRIYGGSLSTDMQNKGICLISLKLSNYKKNWSTEIRQLIFRFRRRVETVFSQLSGQLNAERVLAKSFQALCTRIQNKVLGHNLCMGTGRHKPPNKTSTQGGKMKEIVEKIWSVFRAPDQCLKRKKGLHEKRACVYIIGHYSDSRTDR